MIIALSNGASKSNIENMSRSIKEIEEANKEALQRRLEATRRSEALKKKVRRVASIDPLRITRFVVALCGAAIAFAGALSYFTAKEALDGALPVREIALALVGLAILSFGLSLRRKE